MLVGFFSLPFHPLVCFFALSSFSSPCPPSTTATFLIPRMFRFYSWMPNILLSFLLSQHRAIITKFTLGHMHAYSLGITYEHGEAVIQKLEMECPRYKETWPNKTQD